MTNCIYREVKRTSYYTTWKGSCGRTINTASDIEVGFSFSDPPPTVYGEFCTHCGERIEIGGKENE